MRVRCRRDSDRLGKTQHYGQCTTVLLEMQNIGLTPRSDSIYQKSSRLSQWQPHYLWQIKEHSTNVNILYWFSHTAYIVHAFHSMPAWEEICINRCDRLAYPFTHCSHLYLGTCWCTCLTCSFNPPLLTNVRRHCAYANLLPSWTAEIWHFNVFFHLNVNVQKEQLYEMRVYGASFWFILPTETRLVALTPNCPVFNCPPMCVAGQPVTTWERKKLRSVYDSGTRSAEYSSGEIGESVNIHHNIRLSFVRWQTSCISDNVHCENSLY